MTNSSYLNGADRLTKVSKAGSALPAFRVICYGDDGKLYLSSFNSGNVHGVTTKECAGENSGVSFISPNNYAIFTSAGAISAGNKLVVENTGSGLVSAFSPTGSTYQITGGSMAQASELVGMVNYVGYAIEAASASGDTFLGYFSPRGW
nr:MAG: hypothetical protein [Lokiarchaeota virus Ratatoskr Meg22_1012]